MNPTNVGAIFRSCGGARYRRRVADAGVQRPALPPRHPREHGHGLSGAVDIPAGGLAADARALGFTTAAMALCDASLPIYAPQLVRRTASPSCFGTEGDGLAESTIAA